MKKRVDIEKATLLRKLGWSYPDIARELNCSRMWCATQLAKTEKDFELMRKAATLVTQQSERI